MSAPTPSPLGPHSHPNQPTPSAQPIPAPPPTRLEIERKLSFKSPSTPRPLGDSPKKKRTPIPSSYTSAHTYDSDSSSSSAPLHPLSPGSAASPILTPIAERAGFNSVEGLDDVEPLEGEEDDDSDEGEGGGDLHRGMEGERVLKSGYLSKKQERRKAWKRKWFVLRTGKLAYYKDDKEYSLSRVIDLKQIHTVAPVTIKKHSFTFGIVTPKRTFFADASSQDEMDDWVRAINTARRKLSEREEESRGYFAQTPNSQPSPSSPLDTTNTLSSQMAKVSLPKTPNVPISLISSTRRELSNDPPSSDEDEPFAPSPTPDPTKVILSAYLMKRSKGGRKVWRKRWFYLTSQGLSYTKSHMDTRILRHIPLSSILDALEFRPSSISDDESDADDEHTFRLITAKRTFVLCAPSEEDEIKWLAGFRALLNRERVPVITAQPPTPASVNEDSPISSPGTGVRGRSATYIAKGAVADVVKKFHERDTVQ